MQMEYTVKPAEEGRRVREILRGSMRISYSAMKSAKWNGRILKNGEPVFVDQRVRAGEVLCVTWPDETPVYRTEPWHVELNIPWMDEHLMIVDKPAPMASQSSAGHPGNSLENAVFAYLGCPEQFIYRPVNRLDRGTSGLMVIARDAWTQDQLQRALHTEEFRREYVAMTEGVPDPAEGIIDAPIAKEEAASVRRIVTPSGRPARTEYRVIASGKGRAMVRLRLYTGRTHQIRVHLSAIGCPVCGDFLYGNELPEEFPGRFALHSTMLELRHPVSGEMIHLESEAPFSLFTSGSAPSHSRYPEKPPKSGSLP